MPILNLLMRAIKKVSVLGKAVSHLLRISLRNRSGGDAEQWVAEFENLSGSGHSDGWRFDRDEIHRRR